MKKIISIILAAIMLVGISPIFGLDFAAQATDIGSSKVGDIICFGSYPQSRVTDEALIAELEAEESNFEWIDYGYYAGRASATNGEMKPVENMMQYKDIPFGAEKYRAVKINQYRPYRTGYGMSFTNSERDENGYEVGNTYYFKFEPLSCRVLNPKEGIVMCNEIIDSQAYQNVVYLSGNNYYNGKESEDFASDWSASSLRIWLNEDFYNTAFSDEEKELIGVSTLENISSYDSFYDYIGTEDKIFPISYDDALNGEYGFNTDKEAKDAARQMKGTDYAKCQGLEVKSNGNSSIWLRSSYDSYSVTGASEDGMVFGNLYVNNTGIGVAPAFKINSDSSSTDPSDPTENKLTVSISDISVFYKRTAKIDPKIEAEGENYTVAYSTSDSSVVSVDESGNIRALKRGSAVITCTVTDSNGNSVSDTCTVTVSFAWWQWIIYILLLGFLWY